jgi:hypothetical protein
LELVVVVVAGCPLRPLFDPPPLFELPPPPPLLLLPPPPLPEPDPEAPETATVQQTNASTILINLWLILMYFLLVSQKKTFQKRPAGKIGEKSFANRISGQLEIHRSYEQ